MNKQLWEEIYRIIDGMNFYMSDNRWFAADYFVDEDGVIEYAFLVCGSNEDLIFTEEDQQIFVNRLIDYCAGFEAGRKAEY